MNRTNHNDELNKRNHCQTSFDFVKKSNHVRRSQSIQDYKKQIVTNENLINDKNKNYIKYWFRKAPTPEQNIVYDFINRVYEDAKNKELAYLRKKEKLYKDMIKAKEAENLKKTITKTTAEAQTETEKEKPEKDEKKELDSVLDNIRCYRRNPTRATVYYNERKQDEIDKAKLVEKEDMKKIMMHNYDYQGDISPTRYYYEREIKLKKHQEAAKAAAATPASTTNKTHKFYSNTWSMFVDCEVIEKPQMKKYVPGSTKISYKGIPGM